jgi:hypothetical protein
MNRFITDPENYTFDDLRNYDWDVIQTNITVDSVKMMEWVKSIEEQLPTISYLLEYIIIYKTNWEEKFISLKKKTTYDW